MTQANLFAPTIPPELRGDHLRVAGILLDHRGRGRLTSRQIAAMLGWHDSKAADVRHIITDLIDQYGLQIAGDRSQKTGGYAFADSDEQFIEAQMPDFSQAMSSLAKIRRRLGDRRFRALVARKGAAEAVAQFGEIR